MSCHTGLGGWLERLADVWLVRRLLRGIDRERSINLPANQIGFYLISEISSKMHGDITVYFKLSDILEALSPGLGHFKMHSDWYGFGNLPTMTIDELNIVLKMFPESLFLTFTPSYLRCQGF